MGPASVNTNRAALQALQSLNAANRELQAAQNRVATGLRISGPKDNGAIFVIAQSMRSEIVGWGVVDSSLARGKSALDVATAGAESISDLMGELQQKAVALSDGSLSTESKAAIRADMEALLRQVDGVARNSTFDGINLLTGRPTTKTETTTRYSLPTSTLGPPAFSTPMAALPDGTFVSPSQVSTYALPSSALTPASFNAALATITGSNSQTVTVNAGLTGGRVSLLLDAYGVPDIAEIWQNGVRVAATGRPAATNGAGVSPGTPVTYQQVLSFDYDPLKGDELEFRFNENVTVSGSAWRVGGLVLGDPADPPPTPVPTIATSTTIQTVAEFDPPLTTADPEQVAQALGQSPANVSATYVVDGGPVAGRVDMLLDAFGLPDTVEIFQNGQRVAASGQAYSPGGGVVGAGSAVSGQQVISFDYVPAKGPITFQFNDGVADPNSAWVVGALTLRPTSDPLPAAQSLESGRPVPGFGPINYDFLSSPDGSSIRVSSRDLTPAGLGLEPMDWENPSAVLSAINAAGRTVIEAASYFGSQENLLASMQDQITKLRHTLETGVGNLVDADMAKEAAKFQAAQVRQQLAAQTLSIANSQPRWLLKLFSN